ncbi:MAG TPA: hypothetical protein VF554_07620 [Thermoanaerobaculia bacterium]
MPFERPPLRLGRESLLAALAGTALALLVLRARPAWTHAVIGGGDAWQNLWNLHHVDRVLRTGGSLWQTDRLWAPEGCSLYAHTLSLTNSLPGALLARATGFFAAYNALVVLAFTLAFVGFYRLARRLGAGPLSAAAGAAVFAFAPPHFARALGHLNLLGTGWIPLSLEALFVASRSAGGKRWGAAALAGIALASLAFTDWYLALLGALAAACFAAFEIVRAGRGRRARRAAAFGLAAGLSLAACFPAIRGLTRAASSGTGGHDSKWCSTALTSLVVPSRLQLASVLTKPLTERNHQNLAEGAGYLGLVPLLALLVILRDPRRRDIDFALLAGGVALVFSLGPQPRIFDRLLDVPLPWSALVRVFPALDFGGCVNRFEVLAFLPLALATALAAERLLARRTRLARGVAVGAAVLLALEYAPRDPGAMESPFAKDDPVLTAIAAARPDPEAASEAGVVLDVDLGAGALIRQLGHGRAQTFGYLSRAPGIPLAERLSDPVLGPLLDRSRKSGVPRDAAAAWLRHRWHVGFVLSPDVSPHREIAAGLGFVRTAYSPTLALAWAVPEVFFAPLEDVGFRNAEEETAALLRGAVAGGFRERQGAEPGRWTTARAFLLVPAAPGSWSLFVAAPGRFPPRLTVRWGRGREAARTVDGETSLGLPIAPEDLGADGTVLLALETDEQGVLVRELRRTR